MPTGQMGCKEVSGVVGLRGGCDVLPHKNDFGTQDQEKLT